MIGILLWLLSMVGIVWLAILDARADQREEERERIRKETEGD